MPTKVRIFIGDTGVDAEFFDTGCAKAISDILPIKTRPSEWGNEFYFEIPVKMALDETATKIVKIGDIGYWPPGNALAIFFGPTPMSSGEEPVPASEVNLVGKITGHAELLRHAKGSRSISIERTGT